MKLHNRERDALADLSLPVRGAWVEMLLIGKHLKELRRSPCGERGLKYHYICDLGPTLELVAPRAGSVG